MATLVSKSEVVSLAFNRAISTTKIIDNQILVAELRYIKPILGKTLYDNIVLSPLDSKYTILLPMIKNALAYWVKFTILPEIFVEISDLGAHTPNANNASTLNDQRFIELRDNIADSAKQFTQLITEYLNLNLSSFPEYSPGSNPQNDTIIAGGIIFHNQDDNDSEDDSSVKWMGGTTTKGQTY